MERCLMTNFKDVAEEIKTNIFNAKTILLHCHPFPDPDSVGSVLAMKEYLETNGKKVTAIIGDTGYPANLERLDLKNKIEPLKYSDVKLDKFDLFIILDSSSPTQVSNIVNLEFPENMRTIVIDHHKTNKGYGDINLIMDDCASTTHILYRLFKSWDIDISPSMALNLFIGIYTDTGGFKYPNSTPEVLSIATELSTINPNYHEIVFDIENYKTPIELKMQGLALQSIQEFLGGKVAFST
jgi:phosphoesterase RecJ-like protein